MTTQLKACKEPITCVCLNRYGYRSIEEYIEYIQIINGNKGWLKNIRFSSHEESFTDPTSFVNFSFNSSYRF